MKKVQKILELLSAKEKSKIFFLLFLILIMALVDTLGIASILPFITILANPELVYNNLFFNKIYHYSRALGVIDKKDFIFMFGVTVFLILIFSLLIRALTNYLQIRFSLMCEHSIGKRLVENYLHQPYYWFIEKNSADLIKNVLSEVNIIIHQTIIPILNLFANSAVSIAIITLLVIVDPLFALNISLVLSISYLFIFYFVKNTLYRLGISRIRANHDRFSSISDAFGAFKEIRLGGLEKFYIKKFSKSSEIFAINQSISAIITQIPRFFLESIAFGGMIIIVLLLMKREDDISSILGTISLYAYAGYRLLPALQHIYAAFTQMQFSSSTLDNLHKDLVNLNLGSIKSSKNSFLLKKSINFNKISFRYPKREKDILKKISFRIPALSKFGIIGISGSGKSTVVDILLGLLNPRSGNLTIDGKIINKYNKKSWQKNIGYVPQQIYLSDDTITANIALGVEKKNIDQKVIYQVAKIANIHDFIINELPNQYETTIGERGVKISGGQRQRIGIARALYHKPQIIIFDEATSALDNITEKSVMDSINNLGNKITTICVAHRLSTVMNCDKIILLENGKLIAQGSFNELKKKNSLFKQLSR
jgi:ATP-binding cassette, subfamily B, bacterial PglK